MIEEFHTSNHFLCMPVRSLDHNASNIVSPFGFSNAKNPSCFFSVPQAANCITRVVERANTPVIYLSTDAADTETELLQSLVVVDGRPIPLVQRPVRNSAEKWDALLYRHGLDGDSQVSLQSDSNIFFRNFLTPLTSHIFISIKSYWKSLIGNFLQFWKTWECVHFQR